MRLAHRVWTGYGGYAVGFASLFVLWQLAVLAIGLGMMSRVGTRKAAVTLYSALAVIGLIIAGIRQAFA